MDYRDLDLKGCRLMLGWAMMQFVKDYKSLQKGGFVSNFKSTKKLEEWQEMNRERLLKNINFQKRGAQRRAKNVMRRRFKAYLEAYSTEGEIDSLLYYFTGGQFKEHCDHLGVNISLIQIERSNDLNKKLDLNKMIKELRKKEEEQINANV